MLRSIALSLALLVSLFLCSCSKKVYTHKQVMQSFHSKDDVARKFGEPDIRRTIDSTEEWIYNHDVVSKPSNSIVNASAVSMDTTKKTSTTQQNSYIRFLFDSAGNVVGYKTNGVDLGYVKKVSAGSNILRVLGIAAIVVVIVGLDVYNNSDISF
ncbi:MAG TPA: hypothetical protein VK671_08110 [Mucilaginibacter sp.]|jgi:hypothetical protein|nr:hypothetical protein [Mucilaginibacter sp.]